MRAHTRTHQPTEGITMLSENRILVCGVAWARRRTFPILLSFIPIWPSFLFIQDIFIYIMLLHEYCCHILLHLGFCCLFAELWLLHFSLNEHKTVWAFNRLVNANGHKTLKRSCLFVYKTMSEHWHLHESGAITNRWTFFFRLCKNGGSGVDVMIQNFFSNYSWKTFQLLSLIIYGYWLYRCFLLVFIRYIQTTRTEYLIWCAFYWGHLNQ